MLQIRTLLLLTFLIRNVSVSSSKESCPAPCECKWKKGKETVSCPNEDFRNIPRMEKHSGTQVLELSGNPISALRDDVFIRSNLLNLQELYLSSCSLQKIEPNALRDLINLVRLDLSSNSLPFVPEKSLHSVTQLRELSLSGNPIRKIKNYAFSPLNQLVKLEISNCRIFWIEPYAFNGLETLRRLKIDGNRLAELNPAVWYPLRNSLYGIDLHANPWNCSCALRPTLEWIRTANVPPSVPPICASPPRLKQKSWSSLRERDFACSPVIVLLASSRSNNVTLTCRIRGDPLVNITWFWEGSPLKSSEIGNSSEPYSRSYLLSEKGSPTSYIRTSNLTILNKDQEGGTYRCIGKNAAGHVEESIRLTDAHSILGGGTPVTTLRKRSSRESFIFVLGSLSVGSLVCICLFGACCVYGVHSRSRPVTEIALKSTLSNGVGNPAGHPPTTKESQSLELQNMLKDSEEEEGDLECSERAGYSEGYEECLTMLPERKPDVYVEIEPVMKSELLATARETEIRGVLASAKKPYPTRALLSFRPGPGEEDRLLSSSRGSSPLLDGNSSRLSSINNSYLSPSRTTFAGEEGEESGGHPKIKTFLKEYSAIQSQLARLREARSEFRAMPLLNNSSQNSSPDLRYNYTNPRYISGSSQHNPGSEILYEEH